MDKYANFAELTRKEREGVDYRVSVLKRGGSGTVIAAPHGGGIEPGTSEAAQKIAGNALSLALFEGRRPSGNERLHITSTNFDEPQCLGLIKKAENVVVIHGEESAKKAIFLGGLDYDLGKHMEAALKRHGFEVGIHDNVSLRGIAAANICNRGRRGAGVQLELSLGLRRTFFHSPADKGRGKTTDELKKFAAAVREGLRVAGAL